MQKSVRDLQAAAAQFGALVETFHDWVWVLDADGRVVFSTPGVTAILGYAPEEVLGRRFTELAPAEHVNDRLAALARVQSGGGLTRAEFTLVRKDGSTALVSINAAAWRDRDGQAIGICGSAADITEQRRIEETYRTLVEHSIQGLIIYQDGHILFANPAASAICGLRPDQISALTVASTAPLIHPDDRERVVARMQARRAHQPVPARAEFRLLRPDGEVRWVETYSSPIEYQGRPALQVASIDVTEGRRAEEALRTAQQRLRAYIERATDLIFTLDLDGGITSVNPIMCKTLESTRDELVGRSAVSLLNPVDRERAAANLRRIWNGEVGQREEYAITNRSGREVVIDVRGQSISDDGGPIETFHIARDVTARKRADNERARLIAAIEQAGEAILITEPGGAIVYANPSAEALTDYTLAQLCGQTLGALGAANAHAGRGERWSGQTELRRRDGSAYAVELSVSPVRDDAGEVISCVAIARDVRRERQIETELRQAQKLEAVGRLAGAVAHEFSNQLTAIKGSVQLLFAGLAPEDPRRRHLERIHHTVDHGAQLVRQLLTFSRHHPVETQQLDLGEVLRDMAPILQLLVGAEIRLEIDAPGDLWQVRAERGQIEQVLMNLVINARDALQSGEGPGRTPEVTIGAANRVVEQPFGATADQPLNGAYVVCSVHDSGPGMSTDIRERIFEPFFTTKEVGKGTGLGLAAVFGIVRQHGGFITCDSAPGRGATFEIYLPRDAGRGAPSAQPPPAGLGQQLNAGTARTVLVAEDQDGVREVVQQALEAAGYHVLSGRGVDEALAIGERQAVDLLVTDLAMPGGSGRTLARRLRQVHPAVPVLIMSGYLDDQADCDLPGVRFLAKPFAMNDLLRTVAELLAPVARS